MNRVLPLSWLTTPALVGVLSGLALSGFSFNTVARAAQPPETSLTSAPPAWTVLSLLTLMERYGCYVYSPKTRIDLAAALNTCLSGNSHRFSTKEARSIQKEFKRELSVLRGETKTSEPRSVTLESQQFSNDTKSHPEVNRLKAQRSTLKSQQFSTTTKIQSQVVITFQNGF